MRNVVIVSAVRTAIGKFGGSLKDTSPVQLGSLVLNDAMKRGGIAVNEIDEVIIALLHELNRRNGRFGIAALCIGGGMGVAMVVER